MSTKIKPITQSEMLTKISKLTDLPKKTIKEIIGHYETVVAGELIEKGVVKFGMVGTARVKIRKSRITLSQTKDTKLLHQEVAVPKFKFSNALKELIADSIDPEEFKRREANSKK